MRHLAASALVLLCAGCSSLGPGRSEDWKASVRTVTVSDRRIYPVKAWFNDENKGMAADSAGWSEIVADSWSRTGTQLDRQSRLRDGLGGYRFIADNLTSSLVVAVKSIPSFTCLDTRGTNRVDAEFLVDVSVVGFAQPRRPLFSKDSVPFIEASVLLIANPPYELREGFNIRNNHMVTKNARANPILWETTVHIRADQDMLNAPVCPLEEYLSDPEKLRTCLDILTAEIARRFDAGLKSEFSAAGF